VVSLLFIGFAAGAITGIPIGPVNVAVIDAAYRHTLRRALAVGLGGAIADFMYCALGVAAISPLLRSNPSVPFVLYAISGLILLVYGFLSIRSRPITPAANEAPKSPNPSRDLWSGLSTGLLLIILNPAAVVTWVVIFGPMIKDASMLGGLVAAIGVFFGSFTWFALVAYLTTKGKSALGEKAQWIPRFVGLALIGYAIYLLVRAASYFLAG
jgi:threonine/homoserine/homoserine lactone efflux protein